MDETHGIAGYAFERDQAEFSLGDTLDIKTGLIVAALTFLAIQSGELIKPSMPFYQSILQAVSILCLVGSGTCCVYELIPRDYDRDRTPEEYLEWISKKKAADHDLPRIVSGMPEAGNAANSQQSSAQRQEIKGYECGVCIYGGGFWLQHRHPAHAPFLNLTFVRSSGSGHTER